MPLRSLSRSPQCRLLEEEEEETCARVHQLTHHGAAAAQRPERLGASAGPPVSLESTAPSVANAHAERGCVHRASPLSDTALHGNDGDGDGDGDALRALVEAAMLASLTGLLYHLGATFRFEARPAAGAGVSRAGTWRLRCAGAAAAARAVAASACRRSGIHTRLRSRSRRRRVTWAACCRFRSCSAPPAGAWPPRGRRWWVDARAGTWLSPPLLTCRSPPSRTPPSPHPRLLPRA